ncbi:hypothetical protein [Modestobacter altitudinis]|uniref:hypothetical protein n=1 Tax=Modestobacter altitudinis TaxID=2213158 RepID=UPI00110CA394|nr:hypothetical protein [Modestobacter altitudinis]
MTGTAERQLGRRERRLPAPPAVVWRSLTEPHQPGARPWLRLLDDEVEPRVRRAGEPGVVVWSSLWPRRPDDVLTFDLRPAGSGAALRWTLTTTGAVPDDSTTGHLRYRVNHLLWSELRSSYGQ